MLRSHSTALVLSVALGAPAALAEANPTLNTCQKTIAKESATYVRSVVLTVDKCLGKMSADVVQKGVTVTAAANGAVAVCAKVFARLADTGGAKELGAKLDAKIGSKCDAVPWDAALGTANLGDYCQTFGGDGSVDSLAEWTACLRAAADAEARDAIATRWPRALEYFAALTAAMPPSPARTALVALDAAIEGSVEDNKPDPRIGATGLLATGATQCLRGAPYSIYLEPCARGPKDQDGFARAGLEARYTDHGNGTITDLVTGLTWEKLSDDGSIHGQGNVYTFADAVGAKIAVLNTGAFGGHTDWRLPNRRELESLVDSGTIDPAVRPAFNDACSPGCSVLECSCTLPAPYWTSTVYQPDPSQGWVVDFLRGLLMPKDLVTQAHARAVRGGVRFAAPPPHAAALGNAPASLAKCQKAVATESVKYVRGLVDSVGKCLDKMSGEVVGRGATPAAAARKAGSACVLALRKLVDTTAPARTLTGKLDAKIAASCDPAVNPGLSHLDADTWTIGGRTLGAANLGAYCAAHAGTGTIASFPAWHDCVRTAAQAQAHEAMALRWPRALEYFGALAVELQAAPASGKTSDALAALVALDGALEGALDDDRPEPPPPPPPGLLVTGQTQCVQGDLATLGPCPGGPADQDGAVRTGIARSYTDNGDGTITDHVTGLMWEKLSDDDSIHDRDHEYLREGAHFNKVARLKRHGFAGYDDWRVPNRRELESLVDAGRAGPAIDPIFDHDCTPGCTVLECSCTASAGYRTSTYVPFHESGEAEQVLIDFNDGATGIVGPGYQRVRAVRGGHAPAQVIPNEPPVARPSLFFFPWQQSCNLITVNGTDPDSSLIFLEIVSYPTHGFLENPWGPAAPFPVPANGQIGAAFPDHPSESWGPYDHSQQIMAGMANPVLGPEWDAVSMCYVPFSPVFTGTDAFKYRVRDNEGRVSEPELVDLILYDVP